jgi:benzylsuccinate CoA-transferase BbsE subunit
MARTSSGALEGIRVLDLTINYAAYAARLLADLGADVIRVEPPQGSLVRALPPHAESESGGVASFAHAFLDAGKRSVVIDVAQASGREQFERLVAGADVIIHALSSCPLDPARLRAAHGRLIVATISAFGLEGPYAGFAAGDLSMLAAGGLLSLGGYPDSEPIAITGEQAQLASGIFAAVAVLAALCSRERSGQGVWIDVSGQECVAFALEDAVPEWYLAGKIRRRFGDQAREAGSGVYACQDGYISILAGRLGTAKAFAALTQWVAESDAPGSAALREPQWQDFRYRQSPEGIARFAETFGAFCSGRTKEQLYRDGQARQIAIAPVNTIADLFKDAQFSANDYFTPHPNAAVGRDLLFPGPPYRLSRTPAEIRSAAPRLGEHNAQILRESDAKERVGAERVQPI